MTTLAVLILFAGCIGAPQPEPGKILTETESPEAKGDVRVAGYVFDDLIAPVEGAQVLLLAASGDQVALTTNEAGHFNLSGLAPGPYNVLVTGPAHTSATKEFVARPGGTYWHNFTIMRIATAQPHWEIITIEGYVDCEWGAHWPLGSQPCFYDLGTATVQPFKDPNRKTVLLFDTQVPLAEMNFSITWEGPFDGVPVMNETSDMRFSLIEVLLDGKGQPVRGSEGSAEVRGSLGGYGFSSPLVWSVNQTRLNASMETPQPWGDWRTFQLQATARANGLTPVPPRILHEQQFTVKVALFYVDPAPEDFDWANLPEA